MKKITLSSAKKKAWKEFSIYIRTRDWVENGQQYLGDVRACPCYTCGKVYPIEGKGTAQAGHFIPGRNNQVLFDERTVKAQCYNCNVNLKGNWPRYYEKMVDELGIETVNDIIRDSKQTRKYTIPELEELAKDLKERTSCLTN